MSPNQNALIRLINEANGLRVLPANLTNDEVICDQFYFNVFLIFDEFLNLPYAGQSRIKFGHKVKFYCFFLSYYPRRLNLSYLGLNILKTDSKASLVKINQHKETF